MEPVKIQLLSCLTTWSCTHWVYSYSQCIRNSQQQKAFIPCMSNYFDGYHSKW